jgi:hypothetical protein
MAYRINDGALRPNDAGEFCGNGRPLDEDLARPLLMHGETPTQGAQRLRAFHATMRYGKPSCCEMGTSDEMAAEGWVGLYLKEDHPRPLGATTIETDALTEAVVSTYRPDQRAMR